MADTTRSYAKENDPKGKARAAQESAQIIFSHPGVDSMMGKLIVPIKPDEITWSYGLNTQTYPTYGGEVVQILSMNVGDMSVTGTLRSYKQMERVYSWFLSYMQQATQGRNSASYDMTPVEFEYLARGWKFKIMPNQLPGFKYGREVVAPSWKISASVVEVDDDFQNIVLSQGQFNGIASGAGFEPFGKVTAGIGYDNQNPWSQPYDGQNKLWDDRKKKMVSDYQDMLQAWVTNKDTVASELTADYSKPVYLKGK
jgi:hypothetical protein